MTTASGLLGGHTYFLHWGVIQISLANFVVILTMILLFVLALVLPFPGHSNAADPAREQNAEEHADDHQPAA